MVKGHSKRELIILYTLGLKPKEIRELMPGIPVSTLYYYSQCFKKAKELLIKANILTVDCKLKSKPKQNSKQP